MVGTESASAFYASQPQAAGLGNREKVELFVYFLTSEAGQQGATAAEVDDCFRDCDLTPPTRTAAYLSEGTKTKPAQYVKVGKGYRIERHRAEQLAATLGDGQPARRTSIGLRSLEARLPNGAGKEFLRETIDCFEVGASRATVIMCWLLTLDHLFELVMAHHLPAFNAELAKVSDKRVKVAAITKKDDFADIPENKLIELLRASGVISNDVRKILDAKLGIRNSAAHPSNLKVKKSKAIDFVEDLIENVVLKYAI